MYSIECCLLFCYYCKKIISNFHNFLNLLNSCKLCLYKLGNYLLSTTHLLKISLKNFVHKIPQLPELVKYRLRYKFKYFL